MTDAGIAMQHHEQRLALRAPNDRAFRAWLPDKSRKLRSGVIELLSGERVVGRYRVTKRSAQSFTVEAA